MKHQICPERIDEDGERHPAVVVDVPDAIYLQVVTDDSEEAWPEPSADDERTYSYKRINDSDVMYVPVSRADRDGLREYTHGDVWRDENDEAQS